MIREFEGVLWELIDTETNLPVNIGDTITNFRGETEVLGEHGYNEPPRHEASTGRVHGKFPTVFNLKWVVVNNG